MRLLARTAPAALAGLLLLGGCGSAPEAGTDSSAADSAGGASEPSPEVTPEPAPAPRATTELLQRLVDEDEQADATLPVSDAYAARLPDGTRVAVARQEHPRGGTATRIFVWHEGAWTELVLPGGRPLVPFVATDTQPAPLVAATCDTEGIRVLEAYPPGPPEDTSDLNTGANERWRINATTYAVSGDRVAAGAGPTRVDEPVTLAALRADHPEVAAQGVLEDCRVD